jgi:hypothetical protein
MRHGLGIRAAALVLDQRNGRLSAAGREVLVEHVFGSSHHFIFPLRMILSENR